MESIYLNAGGLRMHALHEGSGEPVIFLHGFPETSREWLRVLPQLSSHFDCYAPDTRGHGKTDKPVGSYSRGTLAADVARFMDAIGVEKAAIVAHDWGGIIASKFVLDWPERVTKAALLDTLCTGWPAFVDYYYWFMTDLPEAFFAKQSRGFIETLMTGGSDPPMPPPPASPWHMGAMTAPTRWATTEDVEHYVQAMSDPESQAADIRYYRDLQFYRVTEDASAPNGERYEHVPHGEMARMWFAGEAGREYLDYAPEDRHKRYDGAVLWMFSSQLLAATGGRVDERGLPTGDPFFDSYARHFANIKAVPVDAGHFFPEEAAEFTAKTLLEFLKA